MVSFVYMVSDEDYSPIFVLEAEEPFISGLKDGKTFRYIRDESELSDYIKSFHTLTLCIVQKQSRKEHIIYLNYSILKSYDLIINHPSSSNFSSKHSKQLFASTWFWNLYHT